MKKKNNLNVLRRTNFQVLLEQSLQMRCIFRWSWNAQNNHRDGWLRFGWHLMMIFGRILLFETSIHSFVAVRCLLDFIRTRWLNFYRCVLFLRTLIVALRFDCVRHKRLWLIVLQVLLRLLIFWRWRNIVLRIWIDLEFRLAEVVAVVLFGLVAVIPISISNAKKYKKKKKKLSYIGGYVASKMRNPNRSTHPRLPSMVRFEFFVVVRFSFTILIRILLPNFSNCLSSCLMNSRSSSGNPLNTSTRLFGVLIGLCDDAFFTPRYLRRWRGCWWCDNCTDDLHSTMAK